MGYLTLREMVRVSFEITYPTKCVLLCRTIFQTSTQENLLLNQCIVLIVPSNTEHYILSYVVKVGMYMVFGDAKMYFNEIDLCTMNYILQYDFVHLGFIRF